MPDVFRIETNYDHWHNVFLSEDCSDEFRSASVGAGVSGRFPSSTLAEAPEGIGNRRLVLILVADELATLWSLESILRARLGGELEKVLSRNGEVRRRATSMLKRVAESLDSNLAAYGHEPRTTSKFMDSRVAVVGVVAVVAAAGLFLYLFTSISEGGKLRTEMEDLLREAESHVNGAKDHSDNAQGHSESAQGHSEGAQGHSESAKWHSESAKWHSESAKGHSESAKGHSDSAKGHSDSAKGHSDSAKGHSESAKGHSDSAKVQANTAKGHADAAKTHSDHAEQQATMAKVHASEAAAWGRNVAAFSSPGATESGDEAGDDPLRTVHDSTKGREADDDEIPDSGEGSTSSQRVPADKLVERVREIQRYLIEAGFRGVGKVDGHFGSATRARFLLWSKLKAKWNESHGDCQRIDHNWKNDALIECADHLIPRGISDNTPAESDTLEDGRSR